MLNVQKHGIRRKTLVDRLVQLEGPTDLVRDSVAVVYSSQFDSLYPSSAYMLTRGQMV